MVTCTSEHMYIASVVATYWFVSISMVYLNKVLMTKPEDNDNDNDNESGFSLPSIPAPLFVTWFQCVVTAVICWAAGDFAQRMKASSSSSSAEYSPLSKNDDGGEPVAVSSSEPPPSSSSKPSSFWNQFPKQEYMIATGRRVLPLSIIFVGMITFNNLCLKWVEVSFYNVARSLTIVFNVFFTAILLGGITSCRTILCLFVVIFGFYLGIEGELNFSVKGTIAGVCSSAFVSLNSIFTKKVLPVVDNDHWRLTYYNNINASVMFIPMILLFEYDIIIASITKEFLSGLFWIAMFIAGFFGFSIGIVTVLQIKATSPLSHNISGTAKSAVQSLLAFKIWGNEATFNGILGIFTVLGGSLLYTIVKMNESSSSSSTTTTSKTATASAAPTAAGETNNGTSTKDTEMQSTNK